MGSAYDFDLQQHVAQLCWRSRNICGIIHERDSLYQRGLSFRHIRSGRVCMCVLAHLYGRVGREAVLVERNGLYALNAGRLLCSLFFPWRMDLLGSCDVSGKGSLPVVLGMWVRVGVSVRFCFSRAWALSMRRAARTFRTLELNTHTTLEQKELCIIVAIIIIKATFDAP